MSAEILKNGEEILACSSSIFDLLYCTFLQVFESKPFFNENEELASFMHYMEIYNDKGGSYWFDVAKYIKSSKSAFLLLKMVDEALTNMRSKTREDVQHSLMSFRNELVMYAAELKIKENNSQNDKIV